MFHRKLSTLKHLGAEGGLKILWSNFWYIHWLIELQKIEKCATIMLFSKITNCNYCKIAISYPNMAKYKCCLFSILSCNKFSIQISTFVGEICAIIDGIMLKVTWIENVLLKGLNNFSSQPSSHCFPAEIHPRNSWNFAITFLFESDELFKLCLFSSECLYNTWANY